MPTIHFCTHAGQSAHCLLIRGHDSFTRCTGFPDLPVPFACDCREQKSEARVFFFGNGRVLPYTNGKIWAHGLVVLEQGPGNVKCGGWDGIGQL